MHRPSMLDEHLAKIDADLDRDAAALRAELDKPIPLVPAARKSEPVLTTFGRMAGVVVALWLIVAVLAVFTVGVYALAAAILRVAS